MYLEKISQAGDIKKLNGEELVALAQEIREFLIEKISNTGGHLASNLGVVELTMALHLVFDLPVDQTFQKLHKKRIFLFQRVKLLDGFHDGRSCSGRGLR